jgi:hypothetical protein
MEVSSFRVDATRSAELNGWFSNKPSKRKGEGADELYGLG